MHLAKNSKPYSNNGAYLMIYDLNDAASLLAQDLIVSFNFLFYDENLSRF